MADIKITLQRKDTGPMRRARCRFVTKSSWTDPLGRGRLSWSRNIQSIPILTMIVRVARRSLGRSIGPERVKDKAGNKANRVDRLETPRNSMGEISSAERNLPSPTTSRPGEGNGVETPLALFSPCVVNVNADGASGIRFPSLRSAFARPLIAKALRRVVCVRTCSRAHQGPAVLESHERAARGVLEREERDVKVKSNFPR